MIAYFDYRPQLRELRPEIDEAIGRVLDSGRLILGSEVEALEREFAAAGGVAGAVGVASGTDALILALRSLEIGDGDERQVKIGIDDAAWPAIDVVQEQDLHGYEP